MRRETDDPTKNTDVSKVVFHPLVKVYCIAKDPNARDSNPRCTDLGSLGKVIANRIDP
jgi:hypothetical protein